MLSVFYKLISLKDLCQTKAMSFSWSLEQGHTLLLNLQWIKLISKKKKKKKEKNNPTPAATRDLKVQTLKGERETMRWEEL